MRRLQDRDSPSLISKPKRVMSRYDEAARDRSPDRRDRRSLNNKSPSDRRNMRGPRDSSLDRGMPINRGAPAGGRDPYDDYNRAMKDRGFHYKVLLLTNLNHKVAESVLRDALMREFNTGRYGDVTVKVCHEQNESYSYIYFRSYDEARDARHAKARLVLFDKPVQIEPVVDRAPGRRNRSVSPEYAMHRAESPTHSTTSANSMTRRSVGGRHDSLERNVPVQFSAHREPVRRDVRGGSSGGGGGGSGGGSGSEFHHPNHRREDSKKEKFPNYLHHVPPEVDDKATRTLFVGNLEVTISETELRRIFERYGVVEDIDVKRPPPGQGNAYAFIKFLNLDMAHRAKVEMSGQYIGKFQCKIGYGKATPTTRIWVGGLGPWTSLSHLEREFDRFGAIRKIDFVKGDNHAYIQYDSIDAAQAACQEMRGFPLGGPEKRLRVDFADPGPYNTFFQAPARGGATAAAPAAGAYREEPAETYPPRRRDVPPVEDPQYYAGTMENHWQRGGYTGGQYNEGGHYDRPPRNHNREQWQVTEQEDRRAGGNGDYRGSWARDRPSWWDEHHAGGGRGGGGGDNAERRKRPRTPEDEGEGGYKRPQRSNSPEMDRMAAMKGSPHRGRTLTHVQRLNKDSPCSSSDVSQRSGDRTNKDRENDKDKDNKRTPNNSKEVESTTNVLDLGKYFPVSWQGGLVLKNSSFPARMHVCSGDGELVESLMKNSDPPTTLLRITQRLRLDGPKLEDVSRKMVTAGPHGHCILLTLPGPVQATEDATAAVQQRPLRNLVTYLKQKDAAGVISLPTSPKEEKADSAGVLYAFPPCPYSLDLLRRTAVNLNSEAACKEDYLVVVVVKGSA